MANNPKLERISIEFAQRINDGFTSAGVAVVGNTDGIVLTALQRMNYINKAMMKLFNETWISCHGEKGMFSNIFPELVVIRSIVTTLASLYVIDTDTTCRDYFQLIEAGVNNMLASVKPASLYLNVKNGRVPQLRGSSANPTCIETGRTICFLPDDAAFQSKSATFTYIRFPINKTDGSFLSMTSGEDSPFYDQWNSKIAEYAENLFRSDAKEN